VTSHLIGANITATAMLKTAFIHIQTLLPVGGDDVAAIADALDAARSVGAGVFAAAVVRSSAFVDVFAFLAARCKSKSIIALALDSVAANHHADLLAAAVVLST